MSSETNTNAPFPTQTPRLVRCPEDFDSLVDNRPPLFTIFFTLVALYIGYKLWKSASSPLYALPGPSRGSFFAGRFPELVEAGPVHHLEPWADQYGPVFRIPLLLGMSPGLGVTDPEIVKRVLVTEPEVWPKPPFINSLLTLLFGPGLLAADWEAHKRQRRMLNPLFTTAQVRMLTGNFYNIAQKLSDKFSSIIETEGNGLGTATVDILQCASAAALDAIGSAGLGHDFDAINSESDYKVSVKQLMPTLASAMVFVPLTPILRRLCPTSLHDWVMNVICPWLGGAGRAALKLRRILGIMEDTSLGVFLNKLSQAETEGQVGQADILSNLVQAAKSDASFKLTEEEAVAQINTMIFGGHETTANTLSHLLQHLAHDPELQSRLRAEVMESNVIYSQAYDTIMNLPLLDAACKEILRLYPPIPDIIRQARVDTVLPLSEPIKGVDGRAEFRELFVPKGTDLRITIAGVNRSPALWGPDAKEFRLDRWLNPLPEAAAKIPGVLSSSMVFSAGAKSCIGWKFAFLEIKVLTAVLLQHFVFEPDKKVRWMAAGITFPILDGEGESTPRLPLKISLRS